ncbi:MAG TPA: hypothetical protein VEQ60_18730, partial [Longimicrobium sp.]|nr:hypothetical protein [Longimicrobium sp.]
MLTLKLSRAIAIAWVFVAVIGTVPRPAEAQRSCSAAFADSLSVRTLRAFERVAAVPPVWDDYTLAHHPLLLLADSAYRGNPGTPVCAGIWRMGAPLEIIQLAARPPFSSPLYGMIDSDSVGSGAIESAAELDVVRRPAPAAVAAQLRARGITRVVALNVPLDFGRLGRLGEMLRSGNADPALMHADLAVHESFHLHSQYPTWLAQSRAYAWPAWDLQPDRAELRERCYAGSPGLARALETELQALVAAFDAVAVDSARRDVSLGLHHARRFVELRRARRALQDTMTVARGGGRISCGLAEDVMELEEGTSMWIGHATTVRAGLTTAAALRGMYAGQNPEPFYQLGPL